MFKLFRIMFKLLRLGGMVFKKKLLIPNAARLARVTTRHHDDRYYGIDLLTRDSWGCLYSPPSSGAGPAYWCSAGPKCQCDDSEPPIKHNGVARVGVTGDPRWAKHQKKTSGICCDIGLAGPDSRLL